MELSFSKYHGLGNDYLVYDPQKNTYVLTDADVRKICHRNYGLGSDGILVGPIWKGNDISVRILNPDGGEAEKSGNGVRIFSRYLKDAGYVKTEEFDLSTLGGRVHVKYLDPEGKMLKVDMGKLSFMSDVVGVTGPVREVVRETMTFGGKEYECTCVSIGNPHCVIPMEEVSEETVCEIGKYSETAAYFPNRINTQIVKVLDRNNIQIEIFERGAGYTLASGSSSCAAAGAAHKLGLVDGDMQVHMPGGVLRIEIDADWNVRMTGSVNRVGEMTLCDEVLQSPFGG
jgi:diaminopimelate epimerase